MTNIQAIDLLKGLEQSLDDYCELNDEGKTAFRMAITALEVFGISEQLPSAQTVARDINVLSNDLIIRQAAIDQLHQSYNLLDAERRLEDMPSARLEQSIAQARYEDLCDYFKECSDQGKSILLDREEFKAWLERMHWHVVECDKLARQLEAHPEPCEDAVSRDDVLRNIDKLVNQSDNGLLEPEDVIVSVSYLPSVTPKQRSFSCGQENDLISRKAAIDALGERPMVWSNDDEYALGERNQYDIDRLAIETVPSAQQIIRCRDCRWRKDQSGATAWLPCRAIVTPSDFYCCRAERRGGEQDG